MSSALDELKLLSGRLGEIITALEGSETTVVLPPMSDEANTEPDMNANRIPQKPNPNLGGSANG